MRTDNIQLRSLLLRIQPAEATFEIKKNGELNVSSLLTCPADSQAAMTRLLITDTN